MATSQTVQIPAGARFIDCASKLTPSVVRAALAAGVTGFMKYTRYDNVDRPKYWTGEEIATVLELGGYVMSNWEIQADRATTAADPYAVGLSDGKRNRAWLRSIGYPDDVAAPVSVDQNTLAANFYKVHPFCAGHWDGDGDRCENIGYLDTDGGRALADLNPRIWIPGAFSWSPELYALSTTLQRQGVPQAERYRQLVELASRNEQAVAIQFPSEAAYGIRVDHNVVLKPFNVWCAPYTVADHTDDLKPGPSPAPTPTEDDDMFIIHDTERDWWATIDAGYAIGIAGESLTEARMASALPVPSSKWDEYVAVSDAKKAADRALANGITVNVPPITVPAPVVEFPAYQPVKA